MNTKSSNDSQPKNDEEYKQEIARMIPEIEAMLEKADKTAHRCGCDKQIENIMNLHARIKRVALTVLATTMLVSCNSKQSDLPSLLPATQVVVANYAPAKIRQAGAVIVWTVTDAQKVARLAKLADAHRTGWRDGNSALLSEQSGIKMKFSGAGVNQIFTIQPNGFDNSYSTAKGNLWSREDRVGPATVIKLIPDTELDQLVADIRAVVKDVRPDATPRPTAATSRPSRGKK